MAAPDNTVRKVSYRQSLVDKYAKKYGVDPKWIGAMLSTESGGNSSAVSDKGAIGLMQLEPDTAKQYGYSAADMRNPEKNIDAGTHYFSDMLRQFDGSYEKASAAYNAGPGAVQHYGGVPPYQETQAYVARIKNRYRPELQKLDDRVSHSDPLGLSGTSTPSHTPSKSDPLGLAGTPAPEAPKPSPTVSSITTPQPVASSSPTPAPQASAPISPPTQPAPAQQPPQGMLGDLMAMEGAGAKQMGSDISQGVEGLRTSAGGALNQTLQAANSVGGMSDALLGAQQRGVAGAMAENQKGKVAGTSPVDPRLAVQEAGGAVNNIFHPAQQGDVRKLAEQDVGADKVRDLATKGDVLGIGDPILQDEIDDEIGSVSPMVGTGMKIMAALGRGIPGIGDPTLQGEIGSANPMAGAGMKVMDALGLGQDQHGQDVRGGAVDMAFDTLTDPLSYETLGGNKVAEGGEWAIKGLSSHIDKVLADPTVPHTVRDILSGFVQDPDSRLHHTDEGQFVAHNTHNWAGYQHDQRGAAWNALIEKHKKDIEAGEVPDELRQHLLREAWAYGTPNMREDTLKGIQEQPDIFRLQSSNGEPEISKDRNATYYAHSAEDAKSLSTVAGGNGKYLLQRIASAKNPLELDSSAGALLPEVMNHFGLIKSDLTYNQVTEILPGLLKSLKVPDYDIKRFTDGSESGQLAGEERAAIEIARKNGHDAIKTNDEYIALHPSSTRALENRGRNTFRPTAQDLKDHPEPEGLLDYPIRADYFPHVGTKKFAVPDEIKTYGIGKTKGESDFLGFQKPQMSEDMPDDPLKAMQYRAQLGNTAITRLSVEKRLSERMGLANDKYGLEEDLDKQAKMIKPGHEQGAATYAIQKPVYVDPSSSNRMATGIQDVQRYISNTQRDLLVSQSPIPHAKNMSILSYLTNGVGGMTKGLQWAMSKVPEDLEQRLIDGGGAGASFLGRSGVGLSAKIPWRHSSQSALDRVDMGLRASRLDTLDKIHPEWSEEQKIHEVDQSMGPYRSSPAYVKLISNIFASEFPNWHMYIVPTAMARAYVTAPQRVEFLTRLEKEANQGANERGYIQGIGGPTDEANSALSVPAQVGAQEDPSYLTSASTVGPVIAAALQHMGHNPGTLDPVGSLAQEAGQSIVPFFSPIAAIAGFNPYGSKASGLDRAASAITAAPVRSSSSSDPGSFQSKVRQFMVDNHINDYNYATYLYLKQGRLLERYMK